MPPKAQRKKKGGSMSEANSEVSDMEIEGGAGAPERLMPPPAGRRLRHTESEQSSDGGEEAKRQKLGSPLKKAGVGDAVVVAGEGGAGAGVSGGRVPVGDLSGSERASEEQRASRSRAKRSPLKSVGGVTVLEMKGVTDSLLDLLCESQCSSETTREVISLASKYEEMLMRAIVENERLKGKLEAFEQLAARGVVGPAPGPSVAAAVAAPLVVSQTVPAVPVAVPVRKPVETWSVVVRSKKGKSSKEVVKKVVDEVGPTLGVRVHEVKEVRDGGAVISNLLRYLFVSRYEPGRWW